MTTRDEARKAFEIIAQFAEDQGDDPRGIVRRCNLSEFIASANALGYTVEFSLDSRMKELGKPYKLTGNDGGTWRQDMMQDVTLTINDTLTTDDMPCLPCQIHYLYFGGGAASGFEYQEFVCEC